MGGFLELFSVSVIFGRVPKFLYLQCPGALSRSSSVHVNGWLTFIDEMLYDVGLMWILEEACTEKTGKRGMFEDECTQAWENKGSFEK